MPPPKRSEARKELRFDVINHLPEDDRRGSRGRRGRAARERGLLDIAVHNLRDFTTDRHHVVDDVPFGGGPGMVMKPEPLFAADAIVERRGQPGAVLLLTPAGGVLAAGARRLALRTWCCAAATRGLTSGARAVGHRRGVHRRLRAVGGELPALVIIDAVARLVPASSATNSRWKGIRSNAGCSITRTTRAPRSSRECACPRC